MTHREKHERRKEMAALVKQGKSLNNVANRFRVSLETVRQACKQFEVEYTHPGEPSSAK